MVDLMRSDACWPAPSMAARSWLNGPRPRDAGCSLPTFAPGKSEILSGGDGTFIPDRLGPKRTESLAGTTFEVKPEPTRRPHRRGAADSRLRRLPDQEVDRDASGAETVKPGAIVKPAREGSAAFVDWVTMLPNAASPEAAPAIAFPDGDKPNTIPKTAATAGSPVKEFPKSGLVEIGKDAERKFYIPVLARTQKVEHTVAGTSIQDNPGGDRLRRISPFDAGGLG